MNTNEDELADRKERIALLEKRSEKEYGWFRSIMVSASSLLGLIISLHSGKSDSGYTHTLYASGVLLLSAGILLSAFHLYGEPLSYKRLVKARETKQHDALPDAGTAISPNPLFFHARTVALCCFVLSVFCLALFAVAMDS